MRHEIVRMEHITKKLHGATVLEDVRFNVFKGEIVGLLGLNGSGKTSLMEILTGRVPPNAGRVFVHEKLIKGIEIRFLRKKIYYIGQNLPLIDDMSIHENISIMGGEKPNKLFLNKSILLEQTTALLDRVGLKCSPDELVSTLTTQQKHLVVLCIVLCIGAEVIIFDGITSAYDEIAMEKLLLLVQRLRSKGLAFVFVDNRIDFMFQQAERIFILREGKNLITLYGDNYSVQNVLRILSWSGKNDCVQNKVAEGVLIPSSLEIYRVAHLSYKKFFEDISFSVQKQEVLGLAIKNEKTRTLLGNILIGQKKPSEGSVYIDGERVKIKNARSAIQRGIGYIGSYAYRCGLFENFSIKNNLSMILPFKKGLGNIIIHPRIENYIALKTLDDIGIHKSPIDTIAELTDLERLKLLLSKWSIIKSRIIILINPTFGLDLVAKEEAFSFLKGIVEKGVSLLLISSDISELIRLSNRIILFEKGSIKENLSVDSLTREENVKAHILQTFIYE